MLRKVIELVMLGLLAAVMLCGPMSTVAVWAVSAPDECRAGDYWTSPATFW